jgi:hypothetical protein
MKKGMVWAVGLIAVIVLGLFFSPAEAQKKKAQNVNLRAIFRDLAPGEGTMGDKIQSDGKGAYVNGVDGVQCYITPDGELKFFVDSRKRHVVVELGEEQRAPNPFDPSDPRDPWELPTYPTDYYSGPIGDFEFRTENTVYANYPINLLQMVPDPYTGLVSQWGAAMFRYMPTNWAGDRYFLRFYREGYNPATICTKTGCDLLVTGRDLNLDSKIDSWDLEPLPGEHINSAYAWKYFKEVHTCYGWFYVPFKLTVERLK